VPDFSVQGLTPFPGEGFNASDSSVHSHCPIDLPWAAIGVAGMEFDIIERAANDRIVGDPFRKFHLDPSWFELVFKMNANYHTSQSRTEVLWRALCADKDIRRNSPAPRELSKMFKIMICAVICAAADRQYNKEFTENVRTTVLTKLLSAMAVSQGNLSHGLYMIRPEALQDIHTEVRVQIRERNLEGPLFDNARKTIENLCTIAATDADACTPTREDIEHYLGRKSQPLTTEDGIVDIPDSIRPFAMIHDLVYGGRRLFLARKKYLGLGPVSLQKGDAVFILSGAVAPFVLRPTPASVAGRRTFNLVGEAYVHGIMKGEVFKQDGDSATRIEDILLA
jgi:hypothetical protein